VVTIDELRTAPIEVVLEHIIENNEHVTPSIVAARIVSVLDTLGWKIERK
jgi:hypothetical protein